MGANASAEKGDEALRFVGTVELWKNIVVAVLVGAATLVGIVALLRYHSDWKSGRFRVTEATCAPPHPETTCDSENRCHTKRVAHCSKITVDGISQPFVAAYAEPDTPPAVGDEVEVFYAPDKTKAFLAHDDFVDEYKGWIVAGLVLLLVGTSASAWFQYHVRHSHLAQRVAGGAAVFDMATGRGF